MNPWTDDELAAQLAERLDAPDQFETIGEGELQILLSTFAELETGISELDSRFVAQLGATLNGDHEVESPSLVNYWQQRWRRWSAGWLRLTNLLRDLAKSNRIRAIRPMVVWATLVLIIGWIALNQINNSRLQLEASDPISLMTFRADSTSREPVASYSLSDNRSGLFSGLDSYTAARVGQDELMRNSEANLLIPPASPNIEATDSNDRFADLSLSQEARFVLGVEDVRTTQLSVEQVIVEQGGLVSELTADLSSTGLPQADMHLLVPIENFKTTMDQLRLLGNEVLIETQTTRDLTEEVFDLEARLANQELVETEIGELLAASQERGDDAETILEIYDDLVSQREAIEATRGEQLTLNDQIQFASIQVQLVGVEVIEAPETPEPAPFWATVIFADAWVSLVTMLQSWAVLLIWMAVYAPLVLLPAGILALLRRLWRQRNQGRK